MEADNFASEELNTTCFKSNARILGPNEPCPSGAFQVEGTVIGVGKKDGLLCVEINPNDWKDSGKSKCHCKDRGDAPPPPPPRCPLPKLKQRVRERSDWEEEFKKTRPEKPPKPFLGDENFDVIVKKAEERLKEATLSKKSGERGRAKRLNSKGETEDGDGDDDDDGEGLGGKDNETITTITQLPTEEYVTHDAQGKPKKETCFVFDICVQAKKIKGKKKGPRKVKDCECCKGEQAKKTVSVKTSFLTRQPFPQTIVSVAKSKT